MGRKGVSLEIKLTAVEQYKRGEGSLKSIAQKYGIDKSSLRQWLTNYEAMGATGLTAIRINNSYSAELKTQAVEAYLRGEGGLMELCKKFKLRSKKQLQDWIKMYNGHKELRASGGQGRGIYMTKGRTTKLDERIEIVSHCISTGKDYGETIEKYGVSYHQIYSWVSKYEEKGVDGLIDKRGKRKLFEEMTEVERLQAENRMLQAENKLKDMEIAVLKKVQEIERRRG